MVVLGHLYVSYANDMTSHNGLEVFWQPQLLTRRIKTLQSAETFFFRFANILFSSFGCHTMFNLVDITFFEVPIKFLSKAVVDVYLSKSCRGTSFLGSCTKF
ncbi:hypothetical protein KFK09_017031 [Dendrobium nobile]|uniref:Uncharacterized protein n=1 Tax=Dendrobium nobile TaxID=94219 RepID=A0A8T3B6C1_DENNO|nr:hypothetical protein KFK09_017031 [Dendrobium nobile]